MKKIINCLFRSAPEVISQGRYSHASDVWSFGVLAWELFAAFYDSNIMPRQTIPYYNHTNDEVTSRKILKFKISIPQGICMLKNQRNIKIKKPTWRLVVTEQHWRRNWVFFYSHTRLHGRRKNYLIVTSLQFPKVTRTWNFSYSITWHLYDFFFQILQSIKKNQQLQKPLSCPDWIHFVIQECCSYEAKERPPAIALFDCLTCRLAMIFSKKVCFRNHESFVSGIYR